MAESNLEELGIWWIPIAPSGGERRSTNAWAIEDICRTEVLGGHVDVCDACGLARPAYNS